MGNEIVLSSEDLKGRSRATRGRHAQQILDQCKKDFFVVVKISKRLERLLNFNVKEMKKSHCITHKAGHQIKEITNKEE